MKAALYCRLSKEDEEREKRNGEKESESIQNQKSMLVRYAVENGYDIYQIYSDEDYSGTDRSRPAFNRMIEAASRHKFDVIIVKTQSRFTRDMELVEKYIHGKFAEWGIRFIAVVDHVDTADEGGKKSRQLNGLVNEWYLEDLSNNVRSVLTHKRRAGKYIGAFAPYGYKKDPVDNNHLLIDPEAAQVVKRIFTLYLAGSGATRIARLLNEEKVPPPAEYKRAHGEKCAGARSGGLWGKATIYRMLTNHTYAGDVEQGRRKRVSYKSRRVVWLPKEDWIIVPGTHEPIIDRASFWRVQQMLRRHVRSGGQGTVDPLAGKVFCGRCGAAMEQTSSGYVSKNGRARKYFRCRTSQRDRKRCPGQDYMPQDRLRQLVLERVQHYAAGHLEAEAAQAEIEARAGSRRRAKQAELDRLRGEISRRRRAMRELYLDKSGGFISASQFMEMNQAFLKDAQDLEKRCAKLEQALQRDEDADLKETLKRRLEEAAEVKTLDRQLVCLLIEKVVVHPVDPAENTRAIEIFWKF